MEFVTNRMFWLIDITYVIICILVKRSIQRMTANSHLLTTINWNWLPRDDPCWHRYLRLCLTLDEWKWELKHSYNLSTYVKSQFRFHTAVFSLSWHSFSHINTGTFSDGKWTQSQFWCLCVRCSPTSANQNKAYIWSHDTNVANAYQ